jgi:hypothetical protein
MVAPFYIGGQLAALADLGLTKLAQEFAPGIPKQKRVAALPRITPQTDNRWVMAVQDHEAARAGKHFDLRLVDPDAGKAHSWAIPKARLPGPGERQLAIQTFTHTPEYALHFGEKKPEVIPRGYGKGRVRMAVKEPVDIVESNRDMVRFNVYQGKGADEYLLRRTKDDKWMLMNTTRTQANTDVPQSKPQYRDLDPEKVDVSDDRQVMMGKIDGAHNTFLLEAGKPVRVFSYRPSERDTGLIEHSHRFLPGLRSRVPKHLDGLVLEESYSRQTPTREEPDRVLIRGQRSTPACGKAESVRLTPRYEPPSLMWPVLHGAAMVRHCPSRRNSTSWKGLAALSPSSKCRRWLAEQRRK